MTRTPFRLPALLALARPRQWYKNAVVFVPLVFSNNAFALGVWPHALLAFVAFCLLSASVYAVNDVLDAGRDRLHDAKRHRPVASGRVAVPVALAWGTALGVGGMFLLWTINPPTFVLGGAFLVLQGLYNGFLKHTFLWDVLSIAIGFVIRALAGTTAIAVGDPTVWLIVCTFLFALYLGLSKRRHEVGQVANGGPSHRPVLAHYTDAFLEQAMLIATGLLLTAYSLYTFFGPTAWMMLTLPFAYYGILRFNQLRMAGVVKDEAELLLIDRATIMNGVVWLAVVVLVLQDVPQTLFAWLEALS